MTAEDGNFKAFSLPEVIAIYANSSGLQPVEAYAFDKYVKQGAAILDIGVGCGRTTPYLMAKASHYAGIDYVKAMIDICAAKFPEATFYCTDATDLGEFGDASFAVAVFSFNGIDAIPTRDGRRRCLAEVYRVLVPAGLFIFSSHNARMLFGLPGLDNAGLLRKIWRLARAALTTVPYAARLLRSGVFCAGEGYYDDPVHGGIMHYCTIPELVEREARAAGFRLLEVVGDRHPRRGPRCFVSAYYYVLAKPPPASIA